MMFTNNLLKSQVFAMAGGDGIASDFLNTIERKIPKERLVELLEKEEIRSEDIFTRQESELEAFSVWGYSENDRNLQKYPVEKGDVIFITYKNAAVYLARVVANIESKELDIIWAGKSTWRHKLLLKDVIKIFIPDPLHNKEANKRKDFETFCLRNSFSPFRKSIPNIEAYYNNGIGFRDIIDKIDTYGNFQGSLRVQKSEEAILEALHDYCLKVHFECIIKEV
ncbi:TPA: hypothetical protein ACGOY6_001278 [Streptococcus suis]